MLFEVSSHGNESEVSRSLANRRLWSLREYSTLARFRIIEHDCHAQKQSHRFVVLGWRHSMAV